jgi:hypothetical protein
MRNQISEGASHVEIDLSDLEQANVAPTVTEITSRIIR